MAAVAILGVVKHGSEAFTLVELAEHDFGDGPVDLGLLQKENDGAVTCGTTTHTGGRFTSSVAALVATARRSFNLA
jgi:hypothetical protein